MMQCERTNTRNARKSLALIDSLVRTFGSAVASDVAVRRGYYHNNKDLIMRDIDPYGHCDRIRRH